MIPFSLQDILVAAKGQYFGTPSLLNQLCTGVSINSRSISSGMLYIPVIGERFDGHSFIPDARKHGALCVLSDHMLSDPPFILVPNVLHALQDIAHAYRCLFDIPVIGITGSVGKTSTKEMVASALSPSLNVLKTEGSLNNQTGVPQILFRLDTQHEVAVIEMGTNHPGEIDSLARMTEPTICLFTNIGVAHIEFFGSREGIFRGKTEMIPWMRKGGIILANGDDEYLRTIPGALLFGTDKKCDIYAEGFEDLGLDGISYFVSTPCGRRKVLVPQPGTAGLYNSLAAIASGIALNLSIDKIISGISSYSPPTGRMCIKKTESLTILDDAYNANPDSMRSSIDVLSKVQGRKICILGDMLELGAESPFFHSEVGAYAASHGASLVLCVGDLSAWICSGANELCPGTAFHYADCDELLSKLPALLQPGDTVLVKASHGIHLEKISAWLSDYSFEQKG